MITDRLIAKLEQFAPLSIDDKSLIEGNVEAVEDYRPRQDIISQGDRPKNVLLVIEGWATRYKLLPDGKRTNMALLIPGDLCDVHVTILSYMDHGISTLSACKIASFPKPAIEQLMEQNSRISRALFWSTLVDESILREWLVNVGRRNAEQRLANLFCEMFLRLTAVGLADTDGFTMPLSQEEIGDTLGLSSVHVNRSLQSLRATGFISMAGKRVVIHDFDRLSQWAEFEPSYLHQLGAIS